MSPFSRELKSYDDTQKRTGVDYIKFTSDYRVVVRILDGEAKEVYKHFIKVANGGKGWGLVCPGRNVCPIELSVAHLDKDDEDRKAVTARRRFLINVLDRTPYTVCKKCEGSTPGKNCIHCKTDVRKQDFSPLNRVKILEQGPNLFNKQLNFIEKMQKEELDKEITEYDIVFASMGENRDRLIQATAQPAEDFDEKWMADPETGELQKVHDLDILGEPASIEEVEAALRGASAEEILRIRGVVVGV